MSRALLVVFSGIFILTLVGFAICARPVPSVGDFPSMKVKVEARYRGAVYAGEVRP